LETPIAALIARMVTAPGPDATANDSTASSTRSGSYTRGRGTPQQ
jgi:hypothetical protein